MNLEAAPISVLVVDDSAVIRNMVGRFLEQQPDIHLAGTAMNGAFAVKKLQTLKPDLIVLDLEMPEMNGIEFLKERQRRGWEVPVIILSSLARKGARITMEALSLGASDFLLKPTGEEEWSLQNTRQNLLDLIRVFGGRYQKQRGQTTFPAPAEGGRPEIRPGKDEMPAQNRRIPQPLVPKRGHGPIEILAIGISTGGPNALRELIPRLDRDLPVAVLIVQHMPAGFTEEFALSLAKTSPLEVKEAYDGDLLKAGRILIAPGDRHMEIQPKPLGRVVKLTTAPPVNGHRPSADVLFESVARHYGNRALAILMTGMGRDGAAGISRIYEEGGMTLAQDEGSSVVFGMPRAAIERGAIRRVVPLKEMAQTVNSFIRESVSTPPQP